MTWTTKKTIFLRTAVISLLCVWFGGFIFYSSFVIAAAHAVLRDHAIVGMITQKVTVTLNNCGFLAVIFLGVDAFQQKAKILGKALLLFLFLSLISLVIIHAQMDTFIDTKAQEVTEWGPFYNRHRIYLIISTVQFIAILTYIPMMLKS